MKKLLSLSLILAVVLSLVGILPAEAKPYEDYPFVYEPFETDDLAVQQAAGLISCGGATSFQWSADGAGGSNGSLSVTESGSFSHMQFPINSSSMIVGQRIRYSCWIKPVDLDFKNKKVDFYIYGQSAKGTTGWNTASVSNVNLKQGEWVYVETEKVWNGSLYNNNATATEGGTDFDFDITKNMRIEIRIGSGNVANEVPDGSGATSLTYLLDDVIVEPVNDKGEVIETEENGLFKGSSFDDTASLSAWSKTSGELIMELANEEGPDGSPNYANLNTPETGTPAYTDIKQSVSVEYNHLYKVQFWAKVNSHDSGSYWFLGWNESTPPARTGFNGYPGTAQQNVITRDWKHFELYIFNEYKGVDNNSINWGIRMYAESQHEKSNGESFSIDDFNIIDMGNIANGDFEMDEILRGVYFVNGAPDEDGHFSSSAVPFWIENGASVEKSSETRPLDEGESAASSQSMLVTIDEDGGYTYQPVSFNNNVEYKISFWAKGNNLASEQPINIRLDRAVDEVESKDAYIVPDEEILETDKTLTNEWQHYEVIYKPAFEAEGSPAATIIPRQPFMNFVVGDNTAGTSYYIDDVEISLYDPNEDPDADKYRYPYAENVSFSGDEAAGTAMTLTYTFVSDRDRPEGRSLVRLLKKVDNGWVTLAYGETDWNTATIDIPNTAAGADIKIELVPIDDLGMFGTVYSYEIANVKKSFDVIPTITEWDEATGEIATSTHIENNSTSLGDQNMVLILAQYDENGSMVKVESKPVTVAVGFSEDVAFSSTQAANAAKACLFVWSGTSLADAGAKIYSDIVSYTK